MFGDTEAARNKVSGIILVHALENIVDITQE